MHSSGSALQQQAAREPVGCHSSPTLPTCRGATAFRTVPAVPPGRLAYPAHSLYCHDSHLCHRRHLNSRPRGCLTVLGRTRYPVQGVVVRPRTSTVRLCVKSSSEASRSVAGGAGGGRSTTASIAVWLRMSWIGKLWHCIIACTRIRLPASGAARRSGRCAARTTEGRIVAC